MVFVYRGKVERLAKEVDEFRDAINLRYAEILGKERYKKLEETAHRVLTPEVFFESIEDINKEYGVKIPLRTPSKFLFGTTINPALYDNGIIKDSRAQVGVGFYVSEESFKHSGASKFTDRIIATYVHEFNHFATFVLQKAPIHLAEVFMTNKTGLVREPDQVIKFVDKLSLDAELSREEKMKRLCLGMTAYAIHNSFELANQIMDNSVLQAIGIRKELPWRHKEREYGPLLVHDPRLTLMVPLSGDPFKDMPDQEAINRFIEWEKYHTSAMKIEYIENVMRSLSGLKVEIMPIQELKRKYEKEKRNNRRKTR
jgi:hypothetical protein